MNRGRAVGQMRSKRTVWAEVEGVVLIDESIDRCIEGSGNADDGRETGKLVPVFQKTDIRNR